MHYYAYFIKYLLINQMTIFCRGVSHKPSFEGLPSEYDGGANIVRHGQSLLVTLMKQDTCTRL